MNKVVNLLGKIITLKISNLSEEGIYWITNQLGQKQNTKL